MIRKILRSINRAGEKHKWSSEILMAIKKTGIPGRIRAQLYISEGDRQRKHPTEEMLKSRQFFRENRQRAENVLEMLADEKSKKVWGGVIRYRTMRDPFPRELCDLGNCYFVDEIVRVEDGEVFIDAGACAGDTIVDVKSRAEQENVKLGRIISFEPEEINYAMLEHAHGNESGVVLYKMGLSDKNTEVKLSGTGAGARVSDDDSDGVTISVVKLDSLPDCQDATWIKMDIEGSELPALKGAEEIIRRNHPKLTICIYHSDDDMIRIAEYIHELMPEYKLYVRQHYPSALFETVLYAIP